MFFTLFILVFALIHLFFYRRFVLKSHLFETYKKYLLLFAIVNFSGIILYMTTRYYIDVSLTLYFFLSLSIGVGFALFLTTLLYEIFGLASRTIFYPKRREFFQKSADISASVFATGFVANGITNGIKQPYINNITLNQNLFQKTYIIAQISDMHIGGLIDRDFVKQSVQKINAFKPDLIAITGDLIDTDITKVQDAVDELALLEAPLGVYFVTGNHEYFHGVESIIAYLQYIGITVLQNEHVDVGEFVVVGVHDSMGERLKKLQPDIKKAFNRVDKPSLFLVHQPKQILSLGDFKPNLTLSGHTHGGQILPFNLLVKLAQPYVKGLHQFAPQSYIYVNTGIGFWGPPMRVGTASEITRIAWS